MSSPHPGRRRRRKPSASARLSEAELRALLASMEEVILVLEADGRYVRIAPTNPGLLYRPPAELLGRRLHDVFPREQADEFLSHIRRCLETRRTVRFEYCLVIRGTPVWFAASLSPMLSDKVVWAARDVTQVRRDAQALRESEQRWRHISEATFEGVGFSENGIMIDVSAQLAAMLGYTPAELIGRPVTECVAPEDRARVAEAIASGRTRAYEHRALRKDGSTFPVETRARVLTLRDRPTRVTAIRDLSERTRLEAELRRRETLAAMGSLVAGVAHEVRTPLFSLSATLDTLALRGSTLGEHDDLLDLLRSQVRRLAQLMEDLLDYGRAPDLDREPGGVLRALTRAVHEGRPKAAEAGVNLELDLDPRLPDVPADARRLQQVFENLVANALQHAPRGSSVRVSAGPAGGPPSGVACRVEDTGPGIAPQDFERLFEPFFSRRSDGTGMGLAVAHRLVEAHGGWLSAANRPGGGAVFTVFLPSRPATAAGPAGG